MFDCVCEFVVCGVIDELVWMDVVCVLVLSLWLFRVCKLFVIVFEMDYLI